MQRLWESAYTVLLIPLLWAGIRILGLFNQKVRRGIRGRKHLFEELSAQVSRIPPGRRIWIHSSSLGEFEQAKPIIARLIRVGRDRRKRGLGVTNTVLWRKAHMARIVGRPEIARARGHQARGQHDGDPESSWGLQKH